MHVNINSANWTVVWGSKLHNCVF